MVFAVRLDLEAPAPAAPCPGQTLPALPPPLKRSPAGRGRKGRARGPSQRGWVGGGAVSGGSRSPGRAVPPRRDLSWPPGAGAAAPLGRSPRRTRCARARRERSAPALSALGPPARVSALLLLSLSEYKMECRDPSRAFLLPAGLKFFDSFLLHVRPFRSCASSVPRTSSVHSITEYSQLEGPARASVESSSSVRGLHRRRTCDLGVISTML